MAFDRRLIRTGAALIALVLVAAGVAYMAGIFGHAPKPAAEAARADSTSSTAAAGSTAKDAADTVQLTEAQVGTVKVEPVPEHAFPLEKSAVGSIDFNEDMEVQVFTPYGATSSTCSPGRRRGAEGADAVHHRRPDLVQASSTLIAAAGVLQLTSKNLERLRGLYETRAISQKDLEQASSDQQSAEGALRAARDAIRLYGKTDTDIDRMIAERRVDRVLVVPSPISGRVTARNAAPGLLVQPGNVPAPFTVADISTMWMIANVAEGDSPQFHVGQEVRVSVLAFPGRRAFEGKITTIASSVDPNTRRVVVRSEIADPQHELRSGMFAKISSSSPARRRLRRPSRSTASCARAMARCRRG